MTMVNQLLKAKGRGYFSVRPDETVYSAIKKMGEKDIGALLVMDRATLVGILTERDYARNVALKGRSQQFERDHNDAIPRCRFYWPSDTRHRDGNQTP